MQRIVLLSSLLWWELGTNSLITGPGEWLSFRRFTSKLSWSWSWVQEIEVYDHQNFSHIILYIGGNNVSNWTNNKYFKEKYDELISFIKEKNKNCQMLLVNSCPRGDTDVSAINDIICSLTEQYKIELVDAHNAFFNKKQELIQKYYYRDEIHLSDSGVKSLVGTISKQLDIVDNYSNCVFSATKQTNGRYKLPIRKTNETHDTWEADRWNKSSF